MIHLYLVVSDQRPDLSEEGEDILVLSEEVDPEEVPVETLRFMTTLLINAPEPDSVLDDFKAWWAEIGGGEAQLELLADEESGLAPDRIAAGRELDEHSWSVQASFVAYPSASNEAYLEARSLMVEAELQEN